MITTLGTGAVTLTEVLASGSNLAGDCFHLITPEIVEADCIRVGIFTAGRDCTSGNIFALGVIRTVSGGLFPAFCFHCDDTWHLGEAQPGSWPSQWIHSNAYDVWTGSLQAASLLSQIAQLPGTGM